MAVLTVGFWGEKAEKTMSFFAALAECLKEIWLGGSDCGTGHEATITTPQLRPMSDGKLLLIPQHETLKQLFVPLRHIVLTEIFRSFVSSNEQELHRLIR